MTYRHDAGERSGDALAASLLLAAAVHAVVIFGISLKTPDSNKSGTNLPTLDVTIVAGHPAEKPENPDYLANINQDGDDNRQDAVPVPATAATGVAASGKTSAIATLKSRPRQKKIPLPATKPPPSAAELIEDSLAIAALSAQDLPAVAPAPERRKHKYVSARTRQHQYANYMAAWVAKVERIGNLNYPDEARRQRLSGKLLLDVAMNPDGSILRITLLRSSGQPVLDDAAVRIVELAAPFAPFPPEIRKETDILHITRTWEFLETYRLHGR